MNIFLFLELYECICSYYFKVKKGVEIESPDGLRWNKNDVDGVLKVIDQACSYSTTYADKNGVEDEDNGNTWFNYWVDKNGTGGLLDNVTDPAIKQLIIPFIKKVLINCFEITLLVILINQTILGNDKLLRDY